MYLQSSLESLELSINKKVNEDCVTMLNDLARTKRAASLLKTLGNPQRLMIISLLLRGEMNVTELNKNLKVSQPALSQHLSRLRAEGVLGARREQRQIYYYIGNPTVGRLLEVALEMMELPTSDKKSGSKF